MNNTQIFRVTTEQLIQRHASADPRIVGGWFWWYCFPGSSPEVNGPFKTYEEAFSDSREHEHLYWIEQAYSHCQKADFQSR